MTNSQTTTASEITAKIFELDAQYQGGIIKAKNRDDFLETYIKPIIDKAIEEAFSKGNASGYAEGAGVP